MLISLFGGLVERWVYKNIRKYTNDENLEAWTTWEVTYA